MEKSIQKDKVIITQTKNKKYESEVASIYSTFSRNSRKVSRQRQSTIEKYQKHDNNLGSYYIASSHDGAFVATFNTVSCFENKDMMQQSPQETSTTQANETKPSRSKSSLSPNNTNIMDEDFEKGSDFGVVIEPRTWVLSIAQNKRINTTIDDRGGVVRFLDNRVTPDTIHSDEDEDSNYKLELILMNSSGIYKTNIYPKLKYKIPTSVYEFFYPPADHLKVRKLFQDNPCTSYLESCVEKNYFFSENFKAAKVDIYNLKTGDLEISLCNHAAHPSSTINDLTESIFAISKYESMVVHCGGTNIITLYLMENGLEITTKQKSKIITSIIIWDIFDSNNDSNLCKKLDVAPSDFNCLLYAYDKNFFTSSSGKIYSLDENGELFSLLDHPDISNILNSSCDDNNDMLALELDENESRYYHMIYELDGSCASLNNYHGKLIVNNIEPWINHKYKRISVFLNHEKTTQLIIGSTTVQIWQSKITKKEKTKKKILKYIWSNLSNNKFDVESIAVRNNKFHLKLLVHSNSTNTHQIHIHYPKSTNAIKDACETLEYLSHRRNECIGPKNNRKFEDLYYHTEKLVFISFNKSPGLWRLNDIRYDIMANLIRGKNVSLIKKILFKDNDNTVKDQKKNAALKNNKHYLHIPRLYGWPKVKKETDLEVAIKCAKGQNHNRTMIMGFLLEYYSNHALANVGWMFTVSQAVPLLLSSKNLELYLKELFYKPCFGVKEVLIDQCFVDPYELRKGEHEAVYPLSARPRLIQNVTKKPSLMERFSNFNLFKSGYEAKRYMENSNELGQMTSVHVVPLPDFLLYPNGIKDKKLETKSLFLKLLKLLIWPREYVIKKEEDSSAFLQVIKHNGNELIFDNPSLEACIKYKYPPAKIFYARQLLLYIAFSISIIYHLGVTTFSNNNFAKPDDAREYANLFYSPVKNTYVFIIVLYFGYYLLAIEFIQVRQEKIQRYFSLFNFIDIISIVVPFATSIGNYIIAIFSYAESINFINQGNDDSQALEDFLTARFDLVKINRYAIIINSFVVLIIWLQAVTFARPAYFINLIIDIISSVWPFLAFMLIAIGGFGHAMYILLNDPASIGLTPNTSGYGVSDTSIPEGDPNPYANIEIEPIVNVKDVNDNFFFDFGKSVESVYFWPLGRWDQIDQWDFWPVDALSICDGIFEEASQNVKQKTLKIRADLLADYETLEKPFGNSRGNPQYIYYVGKANELENWLSKTEKFHSKRSKSLLLGEDASSCLYDFEYEEFIDDDECDEGKDDVYINEESKKTMHKDNDADKISSSKLDGGDKYGDNNEKTCRPGENMRFVVRTCEIVDTEFNKETKKKNKNDGSSNSNDKGKDKDIVDNSLTKSLDIEENLNSLQNNVKNLAKNLDSNVTNRIDTIENDIKEIKELLKLNFNK
ncbi:3623_t:CDS:2 [Entrophospora sp. SA101]|nr:3623_t:CDS:2 [Entrophospora sp. SA101]